MTVVSDEIHSDFVYPGNKHTAFANIKEEFQNITVTCTAPSKTFNLAGLQVSNIIIPNDKLRKKFRKQISAAGYSQVNALGLVACESAYRNGRQWLDSLKEYLIENLNFVRVYLEENIPSVKLIEPEGTYLIWLDFGELGLENEELEQVIKDSSYLLIKRSGFVDSSEYALQQMRKRDLYVFSSGSCFAHTFRGRIIEERNGGKHPVFRYAKAFFMGV